MTKTLYDTLARIENREFILEWYLGGVTEAEVTVIPRTLAPEDVARVLLASPLAELNCFSAEVVTGKNGERRVEVHACLFDDLQDYERFLLFCGRVLNVLSDLEKRVKYG